LVSQGLVEYALILVLVAVVVIAVLLILGYRLFCSRKSAFLSVFLSPIYKCQVASRSSTAGVPSCLFGR